MVRVAAATPRRLLPESVAHLHERHRVGGRVQCQLGPLDFVLDLRGADGRVAAKVAEGVSGEGPRRLVGEGAWALPKDISELSEPNYAKIALGRSGARDPYGRAAREATTKSGFGAPFSRALSTARTCSRPSCSRAPATRTSPSSRSRSRSPHRAQLRPDRFEPPRAREGLARRGARVRSGKHAQAIADQDAPS
jgi:hypothetical protein